MSEAALKERAKDLEDMDAREAQAALVEELNAVSEDETQEPVEGDDIAGDDFDEDEGGEVIDLEAEETAEAASDGDQLESDVADAVWSAAQMAEHLKMLEALLFAAREPLDKASIAKRLPEGADIPALLEALAQQYENRGVILSKAGGKFRFVTHPDVAHILQEEKTETRKLSRAALETLAIIAYHQPCTRADIEDVRGVAVSKGSLDQLMEIGWVRLRGRRKDAPGRPVLYGTTADFLEHFNLESVGDLPGMADLKAAGLLDARLPPGFSIPTPKDADDGEDVDGDGEDGDEAVFVQDFHDDESGQDGNSDDELLETEDDVDDIEDIDG